MSTNDPESQTAICPGCGIPADAGPCGLDPCDMRELAKFARDLAAKQQPLEDDLDRIMNANLWELYARSQEP